MEFEVTQFTELEGYYRSFQAGYQQLLVVNGPPGLEKTTLAKSICNDAEYIVCNVSPFQLYRLLYKHRHKNFILDDVDHLHRDPVAVRLLKALTDSQKERLIAWHTASPLLSVKPGTAEMETIPMEFVTTSRIIVISNCWKDLSANIRALADRGLVIHFIPTNTEIHQRVGSWFTDDEIYTFIGLHLGMIPRHSMRIYIDALNLKRSGNDWRNCLVRHWQIDPPTVMVMRLLAHDHLTMGQREEQFIAARLGCRATFYRIVKNVRGMCDGETLRLTSTDAVSKSQITDSSSTEPGPTKDLGLTAAVTAPVATDQASNGMADGGKVHIVPSGQIALRPDLMQFKRSYTETGEVEQHRETIGGDWDWIKSGNLLLLGPRNPADYGLAPGQKYIVADGHGRVNYGNKHGVDLYNAQILWETDGVTITDARIRAALKNIADGKGTIYDQAKFLRDTTDKLGQTAALKRARENGVANRQAATIAFDASAPLWDSFINERITPEQTAAIAVGAPGNEAMQRIVLGEVVKDPRMSPDQARQMVKAFQASGVQTELATQVDLFGKNDAGMEEMRRMSKAASQIIEELKTKARIGNAVTTRSDEASAVGVKGTEQTARLAAAARNEVASWNNWQRDPAKIHQVRELAGLPVKNGNSSPTNAAPAGLDCGWPIPQIAVAERPGGSTARLDEPRQRVRLVGSVKRSSGFNGASRARRDVFDSATGTHV